MQWEARPLRDIRAEDIRVLVASGLEEHLQLEYKSTLYGNSDGERREFLLDVCMFANANGGILLLGIPERRDENGQPTGTPDPNGVLGIELPNPQLVLSGYDARVMEAIEERLALESVSIDVGDGRQVIAIRVPNSAAKPHSVRFGGHIYFPSRRERQRYFMSVREIKELVMRTASRLQQAEEALVNALPHGPRQVETPELTAAMIPVFSEDFLVDVRSKAVFDAVASFSRGKLTELGNPVFTFDGLERRENPSGHTVRFRRNGLLSNSIPLPLVPQKAGVDRQVVHVTAIDVILRNFAWRGRRVYEAAGVAPPYVLTMLLRVERPLLGIYGGRDGFPYETQPVAARDYAFPFMQIDDLSAPDRIIWPLCDQAHQTFGLEGSPSFNQDGEWVAPY